MTGRPHSGDPDPSQLIVRAKQRVYSWAIVLAAIASVLPIIFVVVDGDPFWMLHLALDGPILVVCLIGIVVVRAGRIALIEWIMLSAIVVYIMGWDVANLIVKRMPRASDVVGGAPVFLLACILLCLILPVRSQRRGLLTFTGVHIVLNWLNLVRFPWGPVHVGQLTTDVVVIVAVLLLTLLGVYRHQMATAEQRAADLHAQANSDPLTGLRNRRALYPVLEETPAMAVALIDLDDFKAVNDTYGHLRGDAELVVIARTLSEAAEGVGVVARWGGEEFLAVLPGYDLPAALEWSERVRQAVENHPEATTTLSIGLTVRQQPETVARMLSRVDELLYQAKRQGKNCVKPDHSDLATNPSRDS